MEAVPRLPMLWFALKSSPEGTSFSNLKKYIAECYQENPESYSKEVYALETLRNTAMRPEKDAKGCATLKRYYCQLHSLANRFPHISDRNLFTFTWKDLYVNNITEVSDIRFEMAAVLFNIGALHTQVGASVSRVDVDGMKLACTHFQCAAWSFGELREKYQGVNSGNDFMTPELLVFMQQVSFAQAQECILEKSLIDNRKPAIVAKVTAQIIHYYCAALAALLTGGDDGPIAQVIDSGVYNSVWKKYIRFKISYLNCILFLYQGQQAEEQQKMGERVVLYQAAWDKLEEARKESKGMADQKEIMESITFTADVVEAKKKAAINENEFIYHEPVPDISDISAVQGANLVNGISFSVIDPEVMGEDIFARLVPMKAHEASSLYSEEKAKILRKYGTKIEEKDNELNSFLNSLNIEHLNSEEKPNKIPQGIVDRCASLNAKTNAIPDLVASMSNLADICTDVEANLKEIKELLNEEDVNEKQYQQKSGVHRSNAHFTELTREFQKYLEAHQKAGESNDTLRRAMELHVNNLRILSRPLQELQLSVPKLSGDINEEVFRDLKLLLNKVNEMKAQRAQFHADLRISINEDDITSKVVAYGEDKDLKELFKKELEKHDKICALIDQNLTAQGNILSALTEVYAKCAPILKTMSDVKHKKESFFSSLAASYDVYEDLLAKSAKGLEFYKKLQGNVQKLLARVKAARDVQDEERQQRLKSSKSLKDTESILPSIVGSVKSSAPKLKDYLKSGKSIPASDSTYVPPIRPNPLGSEAPTTSTCVTSAYYTPQSHPVSSTESSFNYNATLQQYYESNGYTNPIYQNPVLQGSNFGGYETQAYYAAQIQNSQTAYQTALPYQSISSTQSTTSTTQSNISSQSSNQYQYPVQNMSSTNLQQQEVQANAAYQQSATISTFPQTQYSAQQNEVIYRQQLGYNHPEQSLSTASSQQIQPIHGSSTQQQLPSASSYNPQSSATATPNTSSQTIYNSQIPTGAQLQQSTYSQPPQPVPSPAPSLNYGQTATASVTPVASTSQTSLQSATNWNIGDLNNQMENLNVQSSQVNPTYYSYQQPYDVQQTNQMQPADSQYSYQYNPAISSASIQQTTSYIAQLGSYSAHPGYMYNQLTGEYQYASGYQADQNVYSQYTNAIPNQESNTTDSTNTTNAGQSYTNQYSTVDQQGANNSNQASGSVSYYTLPYGYHSAAANPALPQASGTGMISNQPVNATLMNPGAATYMQSNNNNGTQTTVSGDYENTGQQTTDTSQQNINAVPVQQQTANGVQSQQNLNTIQSQQQNTSIIQQQQQNQNLSQLQQQNGISPQQQDVQKVQQKQTNTKASSNKKQENAKNTSNIDLLSDIDFSALGNTINTPPLQPQIATTKLESRPPSQAPAQIDVKPAMEEPKEAATPDTIKSLEAALAFERKSSCDNLSVCSDLSSLDQSFDWDSISIRNEQMQAANTTEQSSAFKDPFDDPKMLKYFHKEVERYEKMIESLNVKMLNGNTPLVNKWKELQDLLVKDEAKRTTAIGKLFPEKNRSIDCIPYDHARVVLEKCTDDYINAAYVKDLGPGCPTFILAQTPLQNTVNDFWSMIWTQKARTVVCLHTPNEILDTFWPQDFNKEMHFDDFSVTLVKQFDLSHCIELNLKVSMNGADAILDLSLIQIKAWTKSSPAQILGIAHNVLVAHKQRSQEFKSNSPLIMNCLTGSERSGIIAVAICAILATRTKRPVLINVVDVWFRICSQRKSALRDTNNLQLSMQIVLSHAHDVLNKRGIMTSYQMKNAQTAASIEKEEVKDPLNDLDPLWKLKQK